jgi:hypothetical protein
MKRRAAVVTLGLDAAAVLAALGAAVLLGACGSCDSTARQIAMPVVSSGSFDGAELDQTSRLMYLADRTDKGIDIVDLSSANPRFVGTLALGAAPNGLALAPDRHRLYAGLGTGVVAAIDVDPKSKKFRSVVDRLQIDKANADLLDYSAADRRLYAGAGSDVVVVDASTDTVQGRLAIGVPLEQPRFDPADGNLYVTAAGGNPLLQVNPSTGIVTRRFALAGCRASGMAINPARQVAMVACSGSMVLFNLKSGATSVSRAVAGGDIVTYDSGLDRFVVASPHGLHDSALGVFYGDGTFLGSVAATPAAHAAVISDHDGRVYAPGALGLLSFSPAQCAPLPDWMTFTVGLLPFATPLAAFGLVLFVYARTQQRREAAREVAVPAWKRRRDDIEEERRRMRELEDSILDWRPDSPD